MEKVNKLEPTHELYIIDKLTKENNKIVLRIPPLHYELNLIKQAWSSVKSYVKINKTSLKLPDVQKLLNEGME